MRTQDSPSPCCWPMREEGSQWPIRAPSPPRRHRPGRPPHGARRWAAATDPETPLDFWRSHTRHILGSDEKGITEGPRGPGQAARGPVESWQPRGCPSRGGRAAQPGRGHHGPPRTESQPRFWKGLRFLQARPGVLPLLGPPRTGAHPGHGTLKAHRTTRLQPRRPASGS